jgi:type I restriction enzyme R subunit
MQAIARVNRTFRDKPGGLIVDYIGVATNLREALAEYSPSDRDQAGLVEMAKRLRDQKHRHEELGLSVSEAALYDAIVQNDAAVLEMGDDVLKKNATELVEAVPASATIDWNLKGSVRAAMRAKIRRLLAKYDYPPDHEARAIALILEQAELFATHTG